MAANDDVYLNQVQDGNNFHDNLPFESSWHVFFLSPMMFAVLFMICGMTFLQTGHCRSTNVKSIIAKVLVGILVTILVWWFWGFGFALGQTEYNLWSFDYHDGGSKFPSAFYYLLVLCLLCTSIISGAVTDRMQLWTYGLVIASVAGASFPLIVNWVVVPHVESFNGSGWLVKRGVIDICGAGYIHVIGGLVGTICAYHCGPREGRFLLKDGKRVIVNALPYDAMSATAGTWILIFGWFNYIALCSLQAWGDDKHTLTTGAFPDPTNFTLYFYPAFRGVVNGAIAMAASGFVSTALLSIVRGQASYSLPLLNNALIGGLVGISAACLNADTMGSFFIGVGSGIIAYLGPNICVALGIDDARDVFTVHFLQGFWAVFVTGLWALHMQARPTGFMANDDTLSTFEPLSKGAFYSGSGVLLGYQMVYLVVTIIPTILITQFALHLSKFISTHFFDNLFPAGSNPNTNVSEEWHEDISTEFPYLSSSSENLVPDHKVCKHFHDKYCHCKTEAK